MVEWCGEWWSGVVNGGVVWRMVDWCGEWWSGG